MSLEKSIFQNTEKKSPVVITDKALEKMFSLVFSNKDTKEFIGIRINVKQKGCFGFKYGLEYAKEIRPFEEKIYLTHGTKNMLLLIEPKALMFIIGTIIDYAEEKLSSGFIFKNPNEKGRCGCGESFYV